MKWHIDSSSQCIWSTYSLLQYCLLSRIVGCTLLYVYEVRFSKLNNMVICGDTRGSFKSFRSPWHFFSLVFIPKHILSLLLINQVPFCFVSFLGSTYLSQYVAEMTYETKLINCKTTDGQRNTVYTNKVILLHKSAPWHVAIWQLTNRYMILPGKEAWVGVRLNITKLDGVGLVENKPFTDRLHHFVKKCDMWHMTCDTWHMTHYMWYAKCNMWHVTCNTWDVTCCGGWTFSQKFSSLALTVYNLWYFEDLEENADWLTNLLNQLQRCL